MLDKFIQSVLSDEGYPIVALLNGDGDKAFMKNIIMKSKSDLLDQLPAMFENNKAVYFSLATFSEYADPIKSNPALKGYRTTNKVVAYRSFFTEVDIRPDDEKSYHTPEEALTAINTFVDLVELPRPTMVATGGGYHLYWMLTEDVDLQTWRTWSTRLIACANATGFKLDVAGTNKPTQIFRPPSSPNNKYKPAYVVNIVEDNDSYKPKKLLECLENFIKSRQIGVKDPEERGKTYDHTNEIPLRDWDKIQKSCQQVREGATGSEEHWRGMLSVARLCKSGDIEGDDLCHKLSEVDERYSPEDTDRKLETMRDQLEGTDGMPYACSSFDKINPNVCKNCLYYNRVKSPIVIGIIDIAKDMESPVVKEVNSLPAIKEKTTTSEVKSSSDDDSEQDDEESEPEIIAPEGSRFTLTDEGLMMSYMVKDKDKDEFVQQNELICKQKVYPLEIILGNGEFGNEVYSYLWRIELDKGKVNDAIISAETFTKTAELVSMFAKLGVNIIKASNNPHFAQAMRAFIASAREKFRPKYVKKQLGWYSDCMVYGTKTITNEGDVRRSILNTEMQSLVNDTLITRGTYEDWRKSVAPYEGGEDQALSQMVFATSFAGPLIEFSTIKGVLISLVGDSGCGKSTMQEVAASVWGDPRNQLQNAVGTKAGDTVMSVTRWMGGLANLTVHLEELSNMSDQDASDLAYLITQGSEKNRMQQAKDEGYKRSLGLSWKTIVTGSTNESMRDKVSRHKVDYTAESMRMIEITNIPQVQADWSHIGDKLEAVRENYGHAGNMYMVELMKQRHLLRDKLQLTVAKINDTLDTRSPERFWVQGAASIILGATIARDAGIFPFNIDEITKFLYKQIIIQRSYNHTADLKSKTLFSDMMNDMLSETVVVAGSGIHGAMVEVRKFPTNKLNARVEIRDNIMWVSTKRVSQYARENKLSVTNILKDARENKFLRDSSAIRVTLGKGVPELPNTQTMCYELQLPSEIIDEVVDTKEVTMESILKGDTL